MGYFLLLLVFIILLLYIYLQARQGLLYEGVHLPEIKRYCKVRFHGVEPTRLLFAKKNASVVAI